MTFGLLDERGIGKAIKVFSRCKQTLRAGIGRGSQPSPHEIPLQLTKMSSFRILSSVARRAPSVLGRRGYAEAANDKLKLSFVLPHKVQQLECSSATLGLTIL